MQKKPLFGFQRMDRKTKFQYLKEVFKVQKGYSLYFTAVGIIYRAVEFLFLFLLIAFLVISSLGNLGGITYASAEYMVRNFVITLDGNRRAASEMTYNPDACMSFALAGEGLSVCGNTGICTFSATGRKTLNDTVDFLNPCVRASGKYTIAFENGGNKFIVYNGFSRVYSETTDLKIYNISIADNGSFAVLSSTDSSVSSVTVYDSDFSPVSIIKRNGYVVSAELDSTGTKLIICELGVSGMGGFDVTLTEFAVNNDKEEKSWSYQDIFPCKAVFSDDKIVLVCSDRVIYPDENGNSGIGLLPLGTLKDFSVSSGFVSVLLENNEESDEKYTVAVLNSDLAVSSASFSSEFCSLASFGNAAFLLTEEGLSTFSDGKIGEPILINKDYSADSVLLPYSRNRLYLASKSAAYVIGVD